MPPASAAWIQPIGFAAAFCMTAAFVPQLLRVLKLRSAREISLGTVLLFSVGVALWLVYGIYMARGPVIASNACTLVLSFSILFLGINTTAGTVLPIKTRKRRTHEP